ncbi:MAG: hypothetical protein SGI73_17395 [Chloroflexota bacterium]|nr:hypothetical protein [Chloroflexota bacterium]
MRRLLIVCVLGMVLVTVGAQTTPVPPLIPVLTPAPAQTALPSTEAEQAACALPAGFVPHVVQMGDTLPMLLAPASVWTAWQIAALNCLDDTDALPVGALIFLPDAPPTERIACPTVRLGVYSGNADRLPCLETPPLARLVVWQPFEGGLMLWFADTRQIYALLPDGDGALFADNYVEGQAESTLTPPDGFFAPERGFRVVWDALGGAASGLGWALARETGYDALTQPAGRTSFTMYIYLSERLLVVTAHPDLGGRLFWSDVTPAS